jgi:hypothetical protein
MLVFQHRLAGENDFEQTVLRNIVLHKVLSAVEIPGLQGATVGESGETGIMAVEAKWDYGSLKCEAWIEICTKCAKENSEAIRCGDFHLTLAWRTDEQEGYWDTLEEIIQWDDRDEDTEFDEDLHLEVVR